MTTANNMIMHAANRQNLKEYNRERLHKSMTYENSVNGFAWWSAFYGWCLGFGFISALFMYRGLETSVDYPLQEVFLTAFLTGLVAGGFTGLFALWVSKHQFGQNAQEFEGIEFQEPERPQQREFMHYNGRPIPKTRRDVSLEHDGDLFILTGRNVDTLHKWYIDGHAAIRKQHSGEGPGFDNLPDKITGSAYSLAVKVLAGRGMIIKHSKNYEWTQYGIEELLEVE